MLQQKDQSMLIFDFDGVLMDSVREISVTAYSMIKGTIVTRLDELPKNSLNLFLRNRFHVQPIGDAPVLMQWCLESEDLTSQKLLSEKEYNNIIRQTDEPVEKRSIRFFRIRSRFRRKDPKAWMALNEPVHPLWHFLAERQKGELVILTNKNREATVALCNHFGLQISQENIYSGDNGTNKIENMQQIIKRFKASDYTFVDDSLKNLRQIDAYFNTDKKIVNLILAEWGYVGPDDASLSRKLGYQSLRIDKFVDQLNKGIYYF